MGRESDHIHIATLTTSASVPVRVEYVDRGTATVDASANHNDLPVNHHDFPDTSSPPKICLIYRPGHYDILYM